MRCDGGGRWESWRGRDCGALVRGRSGGGIAGGIGGLIGGTPRPHSNKINFILLQDPKCSLVDHIRVRVPYRYFSRVFRMQIHIAPGRNLMSRLVLAVVRLRVLQILWTVINQSGGIRPFWRKLHFVSCIPQSVMCECTGCTKCERTWNVHTRMCARNLGGGEEWQQTQRRCQWCANGEQQASPSPAGFWRSRTGLYQSLSGIVMRLGCSLCKSLQRVDPPDVHHSNTFKDHGGGRGGRAWLGPPGRC